jgi:hypothetical protein
MSADIVEFYIVHEARGNVDGLGTVLQVGRWHDLFWMRPLYFFLIYIILLAALCPLG